MVHSKYTVAAVLLIALPICCSCTGFVRRGKVSPTSEMNREEPLSRNFGKWGYICSQKQICECDEYGYEQFSVCYGNSSETFKHWIIDVVNEQCNTSDENLQYGNEKNWIDRMCSFNETVKKTCYDKVIEKVFDESVTNNPPMVRERDDMRNCLYPPVSYCQYFPNRCLEYAAFHQETLIDIIIDGAEWRSNQSIQPVI